MKALFLLLLAVYLAEDGEDDTYGIPAPAAFQEPNIIFIIADELGHTDLSAHGAEWTTTNIDELFTDGYEYKNYYVQDICSPSRAAFLTGRYPFRMGLQERIMPGTAAHVPLDIPSWPKEMPSTYDNYYVGKWHLGYASSLYTPVGRGYDEFFGFLQSVHEYVEHTITMSIDGGKRTGKDLWYDDGTGLQKADQLAEATVNSLTGEPSVDGVHTNTLFYNRVMKIIESKEDSPTPFTITYSPQVPHAPIDTPLPEGRLDENIICQSTLTEKRRQYCLMVSLLDDTVGKIVAELKARTLWDNTYIIFSTDQGGMPDKPKHNKRMLSTSSSNYPLRGGKATLFEGGVNGVFTISGGALDSDRRGQENTNLHHAVDVPVTILALAGVEASALQTVDGINVDGINMLEAEDVGHSELFLEIQSGNKKYGYLEGQMKYIKGKFKTNGWWQPGVDPEELDPEEPTSNCDHGCVFDLVADKNEKINMITEEAGLIFAEKAMDRITEIMDGAYIHQQTGLWDQCNEAMATEGYWEPWSLTETVPCEVVSSAKKKKKPKKPKHD